MKKLLIGGTAVLCCATAALAAVSSKLCVREYDVTSKKLTRGIKVAHISDLHESRFGKNQVELIRLIKDIKPDIIVITGDIIEDGDDIDPQKSKVITADNPARSLLEALPCIAPSYMVMGNHEGNIKNCDLLSEELEALGITMLYRKSGGDTDAFAEMTVKDQRILICGANDPYFDKPEPTYRKKSISERIDEDMSGGGGYTEKWRKRMIAEYEGVKDDERLTLLLSHRPEEYMLYDKLSFDAVFSGHAHGGQWRLPPFINGLYAPNQGIFPNHAGGIYYLGNCAHIVSRGLSKRRMIRIFNPPEICVVNFRAVE